MSLVTFTYFHLCAVCHEPVDALSPWVVLDAGAPHPIHSDCRPEAEEEAGMTVARVYHRMMDQYTGSTCGVSLLVLDMGDTADGYRVLPERTILVERGTMFEVTSSSPLPSAMTGDNGGRKVQDVGDTHGAELIDTIGAYWERSPIGSD